MHFVANMLHCIIFAMKCTIFFYALGLYSQYFCNDKITKNLNHRQMKHLNRLAAMALFLPGRGSLDTKGFRQSCPSSRRTPCRRGRRRDEEVSLRNYWTCQEVNGTYLNITYLKVTQNSFPCNRIVTWRHYLCSRKGGMVV